MSRIHKLILQRLGGYLPIDGLGSVYYPHRTFDEVDYTGRPIILWRGQGKPKHPDFRAVDAATMSDEYAVVGQICNTSVDGHDQRALALLSDDNLSDEISRDPSQFAISTGFWGRISDGVVRSVDAPNHVLLFRRDAATGAMPNDAASMICNVAPDAATTTITPLQLSSGIISMSNNIVNYPSQLQAPIQIGNAAPDPVPEPTPEAEEMQENTIQRLQAENDQLKALVEQLVGKIQQLQQGAPAAPAAPAAAAVGNVAVANPEVARLQAEISQLRAANNTLRQDAEWSSIVGSLPASLRGEAGKIAYQQDPNGFLRQALVASAAEPPATVQIGNVAASARAADGNTLAPPPQQYPETFLTPEYAAARQIGNVAAQMPQEGQRIGKHMWQLYGGMRLDTTDIDAHARMYREA